MIAPAPRFHFPFRDHLLLWICWGCPLAKVSDRERESEMAVGNVAGPRTCVPSVHQFEFQGSLSRCISPSRRRQGGEYSAARVKFPVQVNNNGTARVCLPCKKKKNLMQSQITQSVLGREARGSCMM
ncbi:hypothetical protein BJY00DRAFT_26474 [Aspergillus carlsbadensis]|nr:hypothetical protein BJY00DRAFT_26474 [Aspergillus carlsbadensis]